MLTQFSHRPAIRLLALFSLFAMLLSIPAFAQTSVAQGSIQGSVTDPSGAVIGGAKVIISNKATGQVSTTTTSSSGAYNSGGLIPGDYVVRVEARGFKTSQLPVTVQVTVTASGNIKLEVGQESTVVEVQGASVAVNTEQATVQGVLTGEQIDNLPVNGRNFLDLAQLEPGVQMQDGTSFDPTKAGYTSVSINGVFGRTPRIEVDGLDVSDETVGTTTQNIAMSSIQEFNISRSSLDLSTELTSSGAVNLAIRSGTNAYHGQAFYNFRDQSVGFANFPGGQSLPFQRNQFGGRFGGAIIKDKLFFFADSERIKQDSLDPVVVAAPFDALSGGFASPFRSTSSVGKLDWQATKNIHVFYKFGYDVNYSNSNAFATGYSIYANRDNTPSHAVGVDWNRGSWSHSFRFGYLKFHNMIVGGTSATATPQNPFPGIEEFFFDNGLTTGPNFLAPQQTYQSNKQAKYDGSKVLGSHIIRFGVGVNRILGGGFASFYGLGPEVVTGTSTGTNPNDPNPGDYPFLEAVIGNGQGYFTEKAAFGAPAGGQADTRFEAYAGDSWKIKPNFTLTYGLHYGRDTGRTDNDLSPISCSATTLINCSGNLLDQFGFTNGLGNRIRQPNSNFGPQVGFAWDPAKNGKTVIRGGAGIYYENSVFNNVLFDRPPKLASGLFWNFGILNCGGGAGTVGLPIPGGGFLSSVDGADVATDLCFQNIGAAPAHGTAPSVGQALADYQAAYQAAIKSGGPASNVNFVGNTLELDSNLQGYAVYAPNYRTPRSYQMNLGLQREIVKGGVFSADYVRNISLHFPLTIDVNHVGDARYLNPTAATNAIAATTGGFGCVGGASSAAIDCAINAGATIDDFAANGLDSGVAYFGGSSAPAFGIDPNSGAAFAGINPLVGVGDVQYPAGRSVYNALQTEYKQQVHSPFRGVTGMNLQIAYTLSRFEGNGGNDQNFSAVAFDQRNPTAFFGPTSLDRTHQFKFGATFDIAHRGPRFSIIGGFSSPRPSNLSLPITNGGNSGQEADIFKTDLTGDGTLGDLINSSSGIGKPGTFMREVSASGLNSAISNFNTNVAGKLTPAGQALVNASLFTQSQLVLLGAVVPTITPPPANNAGNTYYKDVDTVLSWPIRFHERFVLEPSVSFFNVFNFSNFGVLGNTPGWLTAGPGSANGTVAGNDPTHNVVRSGLGTGVFALGAPRQAEFGLRIDF
ncbi:MAG TPA: carboxypeptidase regulatory-like domain-containing protein [Candidatus Sulfotelmatobacter sp.]